MDYDFKIGDKVVISGCWNKDEIAVVEKITPTGLVKVRGLLYYKNGSERSANIRCKYIRLATEEDIQRINSAEVIQNAYDLIDKNRGKLTLEQAIKIAEILS